MRNVQTGDTALMPEYPPVLQPWLTSCTCMQQAVMLGPVRGADGIQKYDSTKYILRWYRRCLMRVALTYKSVDNPVTKDGASFMGPSVEMPPDYDGKWEPLMAPLVDQFIRSLDALPHHFVQHFRNGVEIMGYKHPDLRIRQWWHEFYLRLVKDEHLLPESEERLDERLGDRYDTWRKHSDDAVSE